MNAFAIFRQNVRRLRLAHGLTQQVCAEKMGMDYKYYQELESGRLSGLTFATIEKVADFFGVEVWKLFHPDAVPEVQAKRARSPKIDR